MKLENNWRYKNLESLEKDSWRPTPKEESYLVITMHELRKKQLNDFTIEDLRIMIGQNIGLPFLVPLAIEQLEKNILVEGDFYEGDLLKNVLGSDPEYWKSEKTNWQTVTELFLSNEQTLDEFDTTRNIKNGWKEEFKKFRNINSGV
ncbi:MAG: contact-dependent growth inhibition system immunity protein [Reichenbachiella sp.]|uniref:contact-dependent growth inhibition system immunity protein n=1 Tax=Reichenbachiella sp. TaxID=2184521 RepID=UPI0032638B37